MRMLCPLAALTLLTPSAIGEIRFEVNLDPADPTRLALYDADGIRVRTCVQGGSGGKIPLVRGG